jgi:hypothetical protein
VSRPSNAASWARRRRHENGNVNTHWRSPLDGGSTRSIRSAAGAGCDVRQSLGAVLVGFEEDMANSCDRVLRARALPFAYSVDADVDYVESERLTLTDVAKTARTR